MQLLNISVPKPCHENWETMSPEEKGRFCSVCSKTVLDFTTKTKEEVLNYVADHANEKMCGRFRNDQLQPASAKIEIPLSILYRKVSTLQAFALALLIVFGAGLFSCTSPGLPNHPSVVGEMVLVDDLKNNTIPSDSSDKLILGMTAVQPVCHTKGELVGDYIKEPGKDVDQDSATSVDMDDYSIDTLNIPQVDIIDSKVPIACFTTGLVITNLKQNENDSDISGTDDKINSSAEAPPSSEGEEQGVSLYPNPTSGHVTVNLNLRSKQKVQIDLFSLDGKYIRTLIPMQDLDPSDYSMELDISDQSPSIYLLRTLINGKVKTHRIELLK